MLRVLVTFFVWIVTGWVTYGQHIQSAPVFNKGRIPASNSLLGRKTSHTLWQSARFHSDFFVLVEMDRINDAAAKTRLSERGAQLQQWVSGNSYLAVLHPGFSLKNLRESGVRNVYAIPPALKKAAGLDVFAAESRGPKDLIAVSCFPIDHQIITDAIRATGARIIESNLKPDNTWFIQGSQAVMDRVAALPFVHALSGLHLEDVSLNYNNRAIHGVQSLAASLGRNLHGHGVVVGIGDNANPSGHIDLSGKLILRTAEPIDYHGTHTSGTIAGGGIINPLYTGMAPGVQLVVNDFSNIIVNSPTYVTDFKMPLTNNSYYNGAGGCPGDGEYNALSNYVDAQLLSYPKLLHVFAAGNDGSLTCSPFPQPFTTIKSGFQTGKNTLVVGNMNNVNYTISSASSRGPTRDGRIKPDLVAGGVGITSTIPGNLYDTYNGTSMSSPTVTGILALITERYKQLHGGTNPDGALLKALVTNSAVDLGNPGPDFTFGFGMISGRTTVEALEQNRYFSGSVDEGETRSFTIPAVSAGNEQIKILLYWPDAPASPLALNSLVNDLDLTVTEPGGTVHLPMILDPSAANVTANATEGADHINNTEQVLVNSPSAGNYTLTVKGGSVPSGPQSFYVTYEVIVPSVHVEYPFGTETWVPGQSEIIRWSAYGGDPNPFTLEYSLDGGITWNLISNAVSSSQRSYAWTVPAAVTTQALVRISRNSTTYTDQSQYPFTILGQPDLTVTNTCPGYAGLSWNSISGADNYEVMQLSGDSMRVIKQIHDTSWLATPLNKDSSYWFSVRPMHNGIFGRRSIGKNIIPNRGSCLAPVLDNDLIIDSIVAPVSGRAFTSSQLGNQPISIHVRNPGSQPSSTPVSYAYQVNGGPVITEISPVVIPAASGTVYTFTPANSFDFTMPGTYKIKSWIHYGLDTIPGNDTIQSIIKNLNNDPLLLSPSFTESFETAAAQTYTLARMGLDSLDRTDFSNSNSYGRLNTFFNSGFSRTGSRSILLDVSVQGNVAADSMINTFNLSAYTPSDQIWLDLYFKKQSPVPSLPGNQIWIRGNDQAAWIPVKSLNDPADLPGIWQKLNLDITGLLAAASPAQVISSSFQVKCAVEGKTPAASVDPDGLPGGGISFDDFIITRAQHDAGMRALIQPYLKNICALGNAEKISVLVKNYGTDTLKNIPVTYAINNDTVTETIPVLGPKDSLQYNFIQTADMSAYQLYHIKTWISNPTDNYRNNDSSGNYSIQTAPLISQYPYLEGFENNNGYWFSGGQNSSWQWGKPTKQIIHKAANGSNAWVTGLTDNYNDNEYSFLYSPCFDLSTLTNPVLSFSHIFRTEDECNCDFHWVEYSLDDSIWTLLGNPSTGINWYDNLANKAWQLSSSKWHVSSYDIPVRPAKIRFRMVMSSDPGTNYEGVGIDDVHIFEKAPVYADSLLISMTQPVSGSGWIDYNKGGQRIFSIEPGGQDLGNTTLRLYRDTLSIRDSAGQYYGGRNWVVQTTRAAVSDVRVRYYLTDTEAQKLVNASGCTSCLNLEDIYSTGVTQYSSPRKLEEDSSLRNNVSGNYLFHQPQQDVSIIPYDNGYYAETTVKAFSEFWLNAGGKNQDHPLAAWLKEFTAVASGNTAILNWTSWQETGSLTYWIEKSSDSIHFSKIGEQIAYPHSDSIRSYQFTDPALLDGKNYYRLVLHFQNGDSLVSPVRKLEYQALPTVVEVYPNPTNGNITIKTPSGCREIQIFDMLGRKLLERSTEGYIQQVSIAAFSPGVYFLKLFTDSGNKVIKLEKR